MLMLLVLSSQMFPMLPYNSLLFHSVFFLDSTLRSSLSIIFFFRLIMTLFLIFFHHNHYCSIFIYLRFLPLSSFLVLQLDITWLAHHLDSTTFLKYLIFYVIDIIRYLVEQIFTRICFWDFVTSSQNISSGKFQEIFSHGNMFS